MSTIKKVALAGATGNIGLPILTHLLEARLEVTVFTRSTSTHTYPPAVKVVAVDYNSIPSLTSALTGQDAAVIAISPTVPVEIHLNLAEAASSAGVKRFIPSEFGMDTMHPRVSPIVIFGPKVKVATTLQTYASTPGGMSYTSIVTGPFLDWGLHGFILDLKGKSVELFDGGNRIFSTTTTSDIAKAVLGVLRHPKETANRAVYIESTAITLKKLTAVAKKVVGQDGWTETVVDTKELHAKATAELQKAEPKPENFVLQILKGTIWGEGYGAHFQNLDNELLGIQELSEEQLEDIVRAEVGYPGFERGEIGGYIQS